MGPNLKLEIGPVGAGQEYQLVKFIGEFDKAGHTEIRDQLDLVVQEIAVKSLVFDFTELKFINSEGIGYLMEIHTHLIQRGRRLVIFGVSAHIADVFDAIGINEIIPVYHDFNEFLSA